MTVATILTCDFTFLEKGKCKEQCSQSSTEGRIFEANRKAESGALTGKFS